MALDNTEKINILFKKVFAGKAATNDSSNRQYFEEPVNGRLHIDSLDVWSEAHLIPSTGIDTVSGLLFC